MSRVSHRGQVQDGALTSTATKTGRFLPRSASWIEEMEKRSRRRIRDLVALAASQGLSENEIGCARISMMARSINPPCKGRIQKRKTNHLQIITFGLQRTAGPYRMGWTGRAPAPNRSENELGL